MKIENQVCNLELSRRLKEIVIKQYSLFYWADSSIVIGIDINLLLYNNKTRTLSGINNHWPDNDHSEVSSAFTASELGELLPSVRILNQPSLNKKFNIPYWEICSYLDNIEHIKTGDNNLANSMAKMLIYLLENGLMELKND